MDGLTHAHTWMDDPFAMILPWKNRLAAVVPTALTETYQDPTNTTLLLSSSSVVQPFQASFIGTNTRKIQHQLQACQTPVPSSFSTILPVHASSIHQHTHPSPLPFPQKYPLSPHALLLAAHSSIPVNLTPNTSPTHRISTQNGSSSASL